MGGGLGIWEGCRIGEGSEGLQACEAGTSLSERRAQRELSPEPTGAAEGSGQAGGGLTWGDWAFYWAFEDREGPGVVGPSHHHSSLRAQALETEFN